MTLVNLPFSPREQRIPESIAALIDDAGQRVSEHLARSKNFSGFIPSDATLFWHSLRTLEDEGLVQGSCFCEWGSGFGVATCLAALHGYEAHGIEIHQELVDAARELASDHELEAHFAQGSFVPPCGQDLSDDGGPSAWLRTGSDGHDELGLDPEELDLVYTYPWPGEEEVVYNLFDRYAAPGALLLSYHGVVEGVLLHRKESDDAP